MLLTSQVRWLKREVFLKGVDSVVGVYTEVVLQQWYDPDPLKGELIGAWIDVPVIEALPDVR